MYRGSAQAALAGTYIYADYCSGEIFTAKKVGTNWQTAIAADTENAISTFGQRIDGELYFADVASGAVYHLTGSAN